MLWGRLQFFKRFHLKMGQNTKKKVLWMRSGSVMRPFRYRQDQFFNLHLISPALKVEISCTKPFLIGL